MTEMYCMPMKFKKFILQALLGLLSMALASEFAHAVNIDASLFFAWQKTPDRRRGNLMIYSPYIFLSKEKCQAKGLGKEFDVKKGISIMPGSDKIRHECWAELKNSVILVCPIGSVPTESIGTACTQIPKDAFEDISSLPKAPRF